jgi:hypothetical protein
MTITLKFNLPADFFDDVLDTGLSADTIECLKRDIKRSSGQAVRRAS